MDFPSLFYRLDKLKFLEMMKRDRSLMIIKWSTSNDITWCTDDELRVVPTLFCYDSSGASYIFLKEKDKIKKVTSLCSSHGNTGRESNFSFVCSIYLPYLYISSVLYMLQLLLKYLFMICHPLSPMLGAMGEAEVAWVMVGNIKTLTKQRSLLTPRTVQSNWIQSCS